MTGTWRARRLRGQPGRWKRQRWRSLTRAQRQAFIDECRRIGHARWLEMRDLWD